MYDVHSYISPVFRLHMAERVGFEPTVRCRITGFQDRLLKPLGHLSLKRSYCIRNYGVLSSLCPAHTSAPMIHPLSDGMTQPMPISESGRTLPSVSRGSIMGSG